MLKGKIFDKHPDKFPANVFTWDNYLWAFINIFSRAIRVGDIVYLVYFGSE